MSNRSIFALLLLFSISLFSCKNEERSSNNKIDYNTGPLFSLLPSEKTGVDFENFIKESPELNVIMYEYYHNGAGVAVGDVNNDDLPDLYFTSTVGPNKLYLNKGNFKFEDVTESAGVQGEFGLTTGVSMVDINADGFLDIYICRSGKFEPARRRNKLFINNQNGTFTERAEEFGIADPGYSTQSYFFDYDIDGDLDLFLLNHQVVTFKEKVAELAEKFDPFAGDRLYRNEGGKFRDVSKSAGIISNSIGYGLSASIGDLNNDGYPDIYVANDYAEHDYLYLNQKNGTFKESIQNSTRKTSNFSMGTDIGDINNDGWADIMVADMAAADNYRIKTNMSGMNPKKFNKALEDGFHFQYMYNTLQLNQGTNPATGEIQFSEIGHLAGVESTDWSWAPVFGDFDNDGLIDLFISNGLRKEARNNDFLKIKKELIKKIADSKDGNSQAALIKELLDKMPSQKLKNYCYRNSGNLSFQNVTEDWGLDTESFSNGVAYGDFDNDGDLDLVVNNIDDKAFIYKNNSFNNYLKIKLTGNGLNRKGIGGKVSVFGSDGNIQSKELFPSRGYLSSVEPMLIFGLGNETKVSQIQVKWPDGSEQIIKDIAPNSTLNIAQKNATKTTKNETKGDAIFKLSEIISEEPAVHIENVFDDFKRESLLPHKMSQFGPALAVGDINGDEFDDFYLGGSKGNPGKIFIQSSENNFTLISNPIFNQNKDSEDSSAEFFDSDGDGDLDLYVSSGGNEFNENDRLLSDKLYINNGTGKFTQQELPDIKISSSCVRPADFDDDGDLDLFVGGRQIPGKYPYPADSYLLENTNGKFSDVTEEKAPFLKEIGMVTDALWSDYDSDGQLDLIIVGEWMPIHFFKNNSGKLEQPILIENSAGWWFSIAEGDFNKDNKPDYVFGNLGLNYKYKATPEEPFGVHSTDFDENGTNDIVLSYYNFGEQFPLRGRECSSNQMPFIKEKFPNYHTFGSADLKTVYGSDNIDSALSYEVSGFEHLVLNNLGENGFERFRLPNEAQISSINSMLVDDFNRDGNLDILAAGNLFGSEVETPRNDAGYGTLLVGNTNFEFTPIPNFKSGIFLSGQISELKYLKNKGTKKGVIAGTNNLPVQYFELKR